MVPLGMSLSVDHGWQMLHQLCGSPKLTSTETSTLWRQEHNGYSHQNPGLINNFITLPRNLARIYFPPDANCSVSTTDHCLRSKNCE